MVASRRARSWGVYKPALTVGSKALFMSEKEKNP
jgi:hypothetical protein